MSSPRSGIRPVGTVAAATLAALSLAAAGAVSAAADDVDDPRDDLDLTAEVTDHGVTAAEVSTSIAAVGTLPDGTDVMYLPSAGEPASLSVVDIDTGELVAYHEIPPKTLAGTIEVLDDGSAYFALRDGGGVILYHWDAATDEVTEIVENPAGELVIRRMIMEDGILYGSTYPNSKVFSYDPETGEVHDYGSMVSDDIYADGFAVHEGMAYVGTGMEVGRALTLDLETGEVTELEVPAEYDEVLTRFYSFRQVGDLIAMAFSPGADGGLDSMNTLFWDTTSDEWVCDGAIPHWPTLNTPYSPATQDGRMYYKAEGEIFEFDAADCSIEETGWAQTDLEDTGDHRALSLRTSGEGEDATYQLIGLNRDGSFWSFDVETGEHEFFESEVPAPPLTAHSVHVADDDRVYMGTYSGPGTLGRFDPASGEMEAIDGPGQADSWLNFGDQLLVGSYGNAVVHAGDPHAEWDWGTNPAEEFRLITDHQQDRIVDQATDGELAALATVSDYGVRGGALTLTDMQDRRDTYRDLVEFQSTASVTFGQDGLIYAGTSIRGGLSSTNSPLDAHLVVFDPEAGEVVDAIVPVEDNSVVAGVATVGDSIWGVTNSSDLFEFDTTTQEVVEVHDLGTATSASPWGLASTVQLGADGLLYGVAGTDVFAFDPQTGAQQILLEDTGYKRMDIADDGTIYVIDGTNLYEVTISEDDGGETLPEQVLALQAATSQYIDDGEIAGPIAHQLSNALDQAVRHLESGRDRPGGVAVQRYTRHLENPKPSDTVTEEAQEDLLAQANAILDQVG